MITYRQKRILDVLQQKEDFITSEQLCASLGFKQRTLQSEISELKRIITAYGAEIHSSSGKGYRLEIDDETRLNSLLSQSKHLSQGNQETRIFRIIESLLTNDYTKSENLLEKLYVSKSVLSNDMLSVRKILDQYNLTIISKPHYGMTINGQEYSIRNCLIKEVIAHYHSPKLFAESISISFEKVNDIAITNLTDNDYHISDLTYQNYLMALLATLCRLVTINTEKTGEKPMKLDSNEYIICKSTLKDLSEEYSFEFGNTDISYLITCLDGKRNYYNSAVITPEINKTVDDLINYLKSKVQIDFSWDLSLHLALALHLTAMKTRAENNTEIENDIVYDIKTNFMYAYEIAVVAISYLNKCFKHEFSENEISFLALHFNLSLEKIPYTSDKKILILCTGRNGNFLLFRHQLLKHFYNELSDIEIINLYELKNTDLNQYDSIFTTIKNNNNIPDSAIYINFILTEADYTKIEYALSRMNSRKMIESYFDERLFFNNINAETKEDALKQMCDGISKIKESKSDLFESVMLRESFGATSFINLVALPHTYTPIFDEPVVAVAILDHQIMWDELPVQFIILYASSIQQPMEDRYFYDTLAKFVTDKESIDKLIAKRSYDTFIYRITNIL